MALPGNGTIPAVHSARLRLAKESGLKIMELVKNNVLPRQIMTKDAFLNALAVDMALGCSTNSMLHLPAIAHECGIDLTCRLPTKSARRHPIFATWHLPATTTLKSLTKRAASAP